MRGTLWTAAWAMVALSACGESLEFRSDNATGQKPGVQQRRAQESDASRGGETAQAAPARENPQEPQQEVVPPEPLPTEMPPLPEAPTPVAENPLPPPVVPPAPATPAPTPDVCRGITRDVKVLVLDFKSGWFAGDGGNFFRNVVDTRCGGRVKVIYAHITKGKVEGNIWDVPEGTTLLPCISGKSDNSFVTDDCRLGSLADIDAAWILSGAVADPDDLIPTEPLYISVLGRLVELKAQKPLSAFFLGSGLGNVDHANAAAAALFPGLGVAFARNPESSSGVLPSPDDYVKFKSAPLQPGTGSAGTFQSEMPLFSGLASLFDYAAEAHKDPLSGLALGNCFSDPVNTTKLATVARDHCGRAALAAGEVGGHRLVLEGNMARFYGSGGLEFFSNVLRYQFEDR